MKLKSIILLSFISYLVIGLYLSINTGISHDEFHEQLSWSYNFEAIKSLFGKGDYNSLLNYPDKYHGIAFQYISQPIQEFTHKYVSQITGSSIYGAYLLSKHLSIFLIFFTSGIFFYLISLEISRSNFFSIIATVLYLTYPYLYGHALLNPKDIPFLAFWLFSTFFFIKLLKKLYYQKKISLSDTLIIAFLVSYLISIRIIGFLIFIQFIIGLVVLINYKKFDLIKLLNQNVKNIVLFIFCFFIFLYILNPIFWFNPYEIINSISHMSSYYNDVCTLTLGECLKSKDLPAKYYFIWILYKLPLISIIGLMFFPFVEKKIFNLEFSSIIFLNLLISILTIIFLLIIRKASIYDEIRHILFLVPLILIISFYILFILNKKLFYILSFISCIFFISDNIKIYPYQYSWLNSFAKFYNIQKTFEVDYWGVSNKNLQKKILTFVTKFKIDKNICIFGDGYTDVFLSVNGFDCFKFYGQVDSEKTRPFIAYQNLRNLKRNAPIDCDLIYEEYYKYIFSKQKIITGKVWYCF